MMRFTSPCDLRAYVTPGEWVVLAPMLFEYDHCESLSIAVPRGFITDLASIPRPVRLLPGFDVNGKSRRPAVLHDYLYCSQLVSRRAADDLFYNALLSEGVGAPLARLFWSGVRAGGWAYYNKREPGIVTRYDFVPDYYWT